MMRIKGIILMLVLSVISVICASCKTVSGQGDGTYQMSKPPPAPPFIAPGVAPLSPEDVWNLYYRK